MSSGPHHPAFRRIRPRRGPVPENLFETSEVPLSPNDVLMITSIIASSDIRDYAVDPKTGEVTLAEGVPDYMGAAISSVKWKIQEWEKDGLPARSYEVELKLWDKVSAVQAVARYFGLFPSQLNFGDPEVAKRILAAAAGVSPEQLPDGKDAAPLPEEST
jgi:hypothetical protein